MTDEEITKAVETFDKEKMRKLIALLNDGKADAYSAIDNLISAGVLVAYSIAFLFGCSAMDST